MSKKLTPWFPVSILPARAGSYEVRAIGCALPFPYHCFDGKAWLRQADDKPSKSRVGSAVDEGWYGHEWRGLAKKP